jgi:hypothetical protein
MKGLIKTSSAGQLRRDQGANYDDNYGRGNHVRETWERFDEYMHTCNLYTRVIYTRA